MLKIQNRKTLTLCMIMFELILYLFCEGHKVSASNVYDQAHLINPEATNKIDKINSEWLSKIKDRPQIALLTRKHIKGNLSKYAAEKFNEYGIGNKGWNNGVLIVIDQHSQQIRVQTGSGIQNILPNKYVNKQISKCFDSSSKQKSINGKGGKTYGGGASANIKIYKNTDDIITKILNQEQDTNIFSGQCLKLVNIFAKRLQDKQSKMVIPKNASKADTRSILRLEKIFIIILWLAYILIMIFVIY